MRYWANHFHGLFEGASSFFLFVSRFFLWTYVCDWDGFVDPQSAFRALSLTIWRMEKTKRCSSCKLNRKIELFQKPMSTLLFNTCENCRLKKKNNYHRMRNGWEPRCRTKAEAYFQRITRPSFRARKSAFPRGYELHYCECWTCTIFCDSLWR